MFTKDTQYFTHLCENCEVPSHEKFCSPCRYLLTGPVQYVGRRRSNGETEKFFNRRWQMRFNRKRLIEQKNSSTLWVQKRKDQDW